MTSPKEMVHKRAKKRDLVVFGEDWGGHPSSTQHLIRRIRAGRKLVWINSIGLRAPKFSTHDLKRIITKLKGMLGGGKAPAGPHITAKTDPNQPILINPRYLPFPGNPIARFINRRLLSRQIKAVLAHEGIEDFVLWTSLPTAVDVFGHLGESASVYYCGDDFGALAGVDHGPVIKLEMELAQKVDLVVASSELLLPKFPEGRTLHLPHGADVVKFSTPAPRATDLPEGKPIAGFYGSISDWVHVEMLEHAAKALPDWNFVFIGNKHTNVSPLEVLPNVHFLGERPHDALPGYVQHWTAATLPFRDNEQIRASNPLKLREYMASGTPIACTEFPAMQSYADLVNACEQDNDAFVDMLKRCQQEGREHADDRQTKVAGETWESRAIELEERIDAL